MGDTKVPVPKSKFPLRPVRAKNQLAPGRKVLLISNLFVISIKQNKPIYQYEVEVKMLEDDPQPDSKSDAKPKKLSSSIRADVIREAINVFVKTSKPAGYDPNLTFNYNYDNKISTLFTLFKIFEHSKEKVKEVQVQVQLESYVGKNRIPEKRAKQFVVRFFNGSLVQISDYFDICKNGNTNDPKAVSLLRCVNTIIRGKMVTMPNFVLTNTNVFPFLPNSKNTFSAGPDTGVIMNQGAFISAKFIQGPIVNGKYQPTLAVNIANTVAAFHEPITVIELLQKRFYVKDLTKPLPPRVIAELEKELFRKQVEATHFFYGNQKNPHYPKYRVEKIAGNAKQQFPLIDKQTKQVKNITICEYFKTEYKCILKYPELPCIIDKDRKLPLEVCRIVDKQRITRKMTPKETAAIIMKTAIPAKEHFELVAKNVAGTSQLCSEPMNNFGLQFNPKNIELTGRELAPTAMIGQDPKSSLMPNDGQYDASRSRFIKPVTVQRWLLTFLVDRRMKDGLDGAKFSDLYVKYGKLKGVQIGPPLKNAMQIDITHGNPNKLKTDLKNHFANLNSHCVDHCIFILPTEDIEWLYRYLQYLEATTKPTKKSCRISCVKYENYTRKIINDTRGGQMFLANLWLKYNTKLGGINFALKPDPNLRHLREGYIFISVDICHPAPNDKLCQSVAAAIGMWDITSAKMSTHTQLRVQKKMREDQSTVEKVVEIGLLFSKIVDAYRAIKGKLPTHIVIMRDGVSEGQLDMVVDYEVREIRKALKPKYNQSKEPEYLCMVIQKRHKTRFLRKEPFVDRRGNHDHNIQPGTVVDNTVVHPTHHTFFLAAHKAIKGTSRPAHVYIVLDEMKPNYTEDDAQSLCLSLSYLSPRCNKSTSIPTPVNMADLAAERGKNLTICWNDDNTTKMKDDERIHKINQSLFDKLGDASYSNNLFYI